MIKCPPNHKLRPLKIILRRYVNFSRQVIKARLRLSTGDIRVRWHLTDGILVMDPLKIWKLVIFQWQTPTIGVGKKYRL